MDKIKITNHQLFSFTANGSIGGSVLVISAMAASVAKQDAWIAALLTPVFGLPVIWLYWFLGSQYTGMTLVGMIYDLFGKWIGFIIVVGFVFFYFTTASRVVWYIGNFISTQAMPETPANVIDALFLAAIVIGVLFGIETIARASELFLYFASTLFFIAMILVLPNAKIENLQPVLENGLIPILNSTILLSCFLTFPLIALMMIYPIHLNNVIEAKKSLIKGYLWGGCIIFTANLMPILVLGSKITANLRHPVYILAKEINVGIIFTRLEFIVTASWIVTTFVIGILFFYAGVAALSQLLRLKTHKRIVIPMGLIIMVMSWIAYPNIPYEANWIATVWTPYVITYGLILPILLLIVFLIKKQVQKAGVRK